MKIHQRGRPRLGSFTRITCLDSIMVEMLGCVPDVIPNQVLTMAQIHQARAMLPTRLVLHRFCAGAELFIGDASNEFFVRCLRPDGTDAESAFEELRMLGALRVALKHFRAMKDACYLPAMDRLDLRVTQYPVPHSL